LPNRPDPAAQGFIYEGEREPRDSCKLFWRRPPQMRLQIFGHALLPIEGRVLAPVFLFVVLCVLREVVGRSDVILRPLLRMRDARSRAVGNESDRVTGGRSSSPSSSFNHFQRKTGWSLVMKYGRPALGARESVSASAASRCAQAALST